MSQRKRTRFRLVMKVKFSWRDNHGRRRAEGQTRDINADGMFVHSVISPPLHSVVRSQVALMSVGCGPALLQLRAVGEVIRVDAGSCLGPGFAIRTKEFLLRSSKRGVNASLVGLASQLLQ
jgi:hypothetical protein